MRGPIAFLAMLSLVAVANCQAQCQRGSRGRGQSAVSNYSNFSMNPYSAHLAAAYRNQLAQTQYLLAQQQEYTRMIEQRLRALEQANQAARLEYNSPRGDYRSGNVARERRKQRNAEKAYELAEKAKAGGRLNHARKHYRVVVRLLGDEHPLGRQAVDALQAIEVPSPRDGVSLLADRN